MGKKKNKTTITGVGNDTNAKFIVYRNRSGRFEMYKGVNRSFDTPPNGPEDYYNKLLSADNKLGAKINRAANKHPEDTFIYSMWSMSEYAREELYKSGYRVWVHELVADPHEEVALWTNLVKLLTRGNIESFPSIELLQDISIRTAIREELMLHQVDCADGADFNNLLENVLMRAQEQWCNIAIPAPRSHDNAEAIDRLKSAYKTLHSMPTWSSFQEMRGARKVFDPDEQLCLVLRATRSLGFMPNDGCVIIDA